MSDNLETQGYCLSERERRRLWLGLRFPTGACLVLFGAALALQSAIAVAALVPIGLVAGFSARHPFDLVWNQGVRHLARAPELPPNPRPRRHAFKVAAVGLGAVATLFAVGQPTAALIVGGVMAAACASVTLANFCVPSTILAWWDRRRGREPITA